MVGLFLREQQHCLSVRDLWTAHMTHHRQAAANFTDMLPLFLLSIIFLGFGWAFDIAVTSPGYVIAKLLSLVFGGWLFGLSLEGCHWMPISSR